MNDMQINTSKSDSWFPQFVQLATSFDLIRCSWTRRPVADTSIGGPAPPPWRHQMFYDHTSHTI